MDMIKNQIVFAEGLSSAYLAFLACRKFSSVRGSRNRSQLQNRAVRISAVDSYSSWDRTKCTFLKKVSASKLIVIDFQWHVDSSGKPAIVSVGIATSQQEVVVVRLFEFSQIPQDLEEMFQDPTILKLGVGIVECAASLRRDSGIDIQGCIDLRYMAMKTPALKKKLLGVKSDLSLESLMKTVLGIHPNEREGDQAFDWTARELTGEQNAHLAERASGAFELTRQICIENGLIPRVISVLRSELWLEHYISHEFSVFADIPFQLERLTRVPLLVKSSLLIRHPGVCVVCKTEDSTIPLQPVHVVPEEYHVAFPEPLDDVVNVCLACHGKFYYSLDLLRRELEVLYDAPVIDPEQPFVEDEFLRRIRRAGILLREQGKFLPEDRREELEALVMHYFFTNSVDDETTRLAASLDYRQPRVDLEYHADLVCQNFSREDLKFFESMWRDHFVLQMKPEALPESFSS